MDPWRYLSDGKSLLFSEDLDNLPVDGLVRSKDTSMEWETKPSYGIESYPLPSNSAAVENSGLMELGFHGLAQKSYSSEPSGDMSSDDIGVESLKKLSSVAFNTSNMVAPGEESSGRISSFFMESNRQDSLMFDLKLGGLAESGISKDIQVFREGTSKLSSAASPSPAKRGRSTNQYLQAPFCQVHGCNKDLSSFKDYYKRHKVCEAHTKTAKVIVNGIEQRFCQQCSRFHLIAEFDEGKRSCRKRLADHNERRRKPQLTVGPGSRYLESSVSRGSSSSLPDMLPTDTFGLRKYENGETMRHINFEVPTASLNVVPDNMSSSGPRERMFGVDACGREGVQNPSHALSLLSDSAPNISTQFLRSQSTSQLMTEMNWDDQGADGRASLHSMMNDSEFTDYVDGHHPEGGAMVNLNQLSSHLQRVEQQRNSEQVRPPDTMFGAFPSSER